MVSKCKSDVGWCGVCWCIGVIYIQTYTSCILSSNMAHCQQWSVPQPSRQYLMQRLCLCADQHVTDDDALWTHNCHWTGLDCVSEVIKVTSLATDPLLGRSHAYIIDVPWCSSPHTVRLQANGRSVTVVIVLVYRYKGIEGEWTGLVIGRVGTTYCRLSERSKVRSAAVHTVPRSHILVKYWENIVSPILANTRQTILDQYQLYVGEYCNKILIFNSFAI